MRQIDLIKLYSQKRCLVVDDMPDVRVSISGMLRVFGVQKIDVVANGDQAIEACTHTQYQMVLCDYNLGAGRDGQQILEELRYRNRLNNTSIFVMITAESSRDMVLGALEYQPDDYVTKPITSALLQQRLDRVLVRHQELYNIKQAMDEKNYVAAEQHCQDRINDNTSYRSACLQIQAEMNLRLFNFDIAEKIYTGVLAERPVLWAKLGLGKTQVAKKEFVKAEKNLTEVIAVNRRVVEAHDLLADSFIGQGETHKAQQAMQVAAQVSPKSVFRQRRLAGLAKLNDDSEVCLSAHRLVIKTAKNSCYESADDYFNLARELTDLGKANENDSDKNAKETFEILQRLEKKPYFDVSADIQSNSLKSRSLLNQKKTSEAEIHIAKAKKLYSDKQGVVKAEVSLDMAQALFESGDKTAAEHILLQLVEKFPNDEALLAKADFMSETPKSVEGRQKVAQMTKLGIDHYENSHYLEAIEIFTNATSVFPNHIGLNLNLIQSVISEIKKNGVQDEFKIVCQKSLKRVSNISPEDTQYSRYQHLKNQVSDLF